MNKRTAGWTTFGGGATLVFGALLPWAHIGAISVVGTDGDGAITMTLGVAVCVLAGLALRDVGRPAVEYGCSVGVAALAALVAVVDMADISSATGPFGIDATVGFGLILTLFGGMTAAAGATWALVAASGPRRVF